MSENYQYHLRGVEVEQQQTHQNFSLTQRLAIFTALVSALTTIMSYHDASIQDEAFTLKNETLIAQSKASGLWAFYQAKSGKENVIQIIKHFSGGKTLIIIRRHQKDIKMRETKLNWKLSRQKENRMKVIQKVSDL